MNSPAKAEVEQDLLQLVPALPRQTTARPTSSQGAAKPTRDRHTTPLWSRRTAEEIETVLREDVANGELTAAEAAELIARVRARAQPNGHSATELLNATG